MKSIIDHDIVFNNTVYTFTQFYPSIQTKVVVNNIIAGTIIQINIPTVIATHTVVAQNNWFYYIKHGNIVMVLNYRVEYIFIRVPVPVTSPRIKRSVIATFFHGIEYIILLNHMSAPGSFTYIDTCTGNIVNAVMANGNALAHRKFNTRRLFFNQA